MKGETVQILAVFAGYLAVGYFIGIPVGILADLMLGGKDGKPLTKSGAIILWPLILVIAILAFPAWFYHWYRNRWLK